MLEGRQIRVGELRISLLWFDSMGAKSSSLLVETPDIRILVDPGVAEMQPSFPLPSREKERLRDEAFKVISSAAERAQVVVITHYHYDHHTLPSEAPGMYGGKTLLIKDPNIWINESQHGRARLFLEELYEMYGMGEVYCEAGEVPVEDPLDWVPHARGRDFGDYSGRRMELLERGRRWLERLKRRWARSPWVRELDTDFLRVRFADGRAFRFGSTWIRFTHPLFHGVEYDRLGWVLGVVIEHGGRRLFYSSDFQGPVIEDYADMVARIDPDVAVIDGPPTYLFGFTLNRINLNRSIENMLRIIHETRADPIIYDHHLLRDRLWRKRVREVLEDPEARGRVMTAAEWLGGRPVIDTAPAL